MSEPQNETQEPEAPEKPPEKLTEVQLLVRQIAADEPKAKMHPDEAPWQVRGAAAVLISEARERLAKSTAAYADHVRKNGVAIFLAGEAGATARFAELAEESFGIFPVDAGEMYDRMAAAIEPSFGGSREFGVTQLRLLWNTMNDICAEIGYDASTAPRPNSPAGLYVRDATQLRRVVREMVEQVHGGEMNRRYVEAGFIKKAMAARYTGRVVTATVRNHSPGDLATFPRSFARGHAVVNAEGEPTGASVERELARANKAMFKKQQ